MGRTPNRMVVRENMVDVSQNQCIDSFNLGQGHSCVFRVVPQAVSDPRMTKRYD